MRFSPDYRTLRGGKIYSQILQPKMSVNTENTVDASETWEDWRSYRPASELIEERIRANLEPLNVQISTLTQLLDQLIKDNSAKTTPTAGPRVLRPQAVSWSNSETAASSTTPDTAIGGTGLLLNIQCSGW